LAALVSAATPAYAAPGDHPKLDGELNKRAKTVLGQSRVIVVFNSGWDASEAKKLGGKLGRRLNLIGAQVLELSNGQLKRLADHPAVRSIHHDRPFTSTMNRVAVTTGARGVQHVLGFTGAGVGVAVIDSGVTSWHDDLQYSGGSSAVHTNGGQRVAAFVDFINGQATPYDDNGHGTHVSGIIAGNGYDTRGIRAGMAPDAHLVSLKVLDASGRGVISNVIAALEYVVANKNAHNIRVANLSIGAAVTESYKTDPLTLAAKRAVDAGIVVVSAAGNLGMNRSGVTQYGGITAPANAPWVLTVGASNHQGSVTRVDDAMAPYSSRGPTALDFAAKPDLVAPGTGVVSLSSRNSLFYSTKSALLLRGTLDPGYKPYLSLSGTSMAAPVVTGAVALMLQANPNMTPNLVKAVLQYTAQEYPDYDPLTQGAGFLNARGAVDLANYFATAQPGERYPSARMWSKQIIWGNSRVGGGAISPTANAFSAGLVWGSGRAEDGDNIVWGTRCGTEDCDNIVWGTFEDRDNIVWGTFGDGFNIVWGTADRDGFNIVWGTSNWSSPEDADNIVWGTDCGGEDCDNIVWGTSEDVDNIVWGTAEDADAIVWGTSANGQYNVWGTSDEDDVSDSSTVLFDDPEAPPMAFDPLDFDLIFGPELATMEMGTITISSEPIVLSTEPIVPIAVSGSTGGQL
jgi:serine protease AprX